MKAVHIYLIGACSTLAIGCAFKGTAEPPRPAGLPDVAIYAGGIDGGEWVSCEPTEDNRIECTLFDPKSGEPRYHKSLRICPSMLLLRKRAGGEFQPRYFDAESARFDGASAFVDRPDTYLPRPIDTPEHISHQRELAEKYYHDYGVTSDCRSMNPVPPTSD